MNHPVMVAARIPLPIHDATTVRSTRKIGRDEQRGSDKPQTVLDRSQAAGSPAPGVLRAGQVALGAAALRAARTGRGARPGGVLLLDNPIGRASSAHLVRLQRDVAASHGVQLIYTTGVKDPAAVIQFPNVIRLDNRQGGTQGRRYIVADADGTDAGLITGVRIAHADRRWDDPGAAGEAAP